MDILLHGGMKGKERKGKERKERIDEMTGIVIGIG
jgi:hypothetical protein